MIAVEAMVILAAVLDGPARANAEAWRRRDPRWLAPPLWRSEVRNAMATMCRRERLTPEVALKTFRVAERLIAEGTYEVESDHVLRLAFASGCTAYDCEYVALAEARGVKLLTADQQVLAAFPTIAVPFDDTESSSDRLT